MLFAVLVLAALAVLIYLRQTETPPALQKSPAPRPASSNTYNVSAVTLRDLQGVYMADGNMLAIFDADEVTATGRFNSRACAVYLVGQTVGLVFTDGSELRLCRSGTRALTIENTKTVLYRR